MLVLLQTLLHSFFFNTISILLYHIFPLETLAMEKDMIFPHLEKYIAFVGN